MFHLFAFSSRSTRGEVRYFLLSSFFPPCPPPSKCKAKKMILTYLDTSPRTLSFSDTVSTLKFSTKLTLHSGRSKLTLSHIPHYRTLVHSRRQEVIPSLIESKGEDRAGMRAQCAHQIT